MNRQTNLHLGWTESTFSANFYFWVNYSFKFFTYEKTADSMRTNQVHFKQGGQGHKCVCEETERVQVCTKRKEKRKCVCVCGHVRVDNVV